LKTGNLISLKILFPILFTLFISTINLIAQEKDSSSISTEFFIYPFVFYSPETRVGLGAGGIFYFKDTTKQFSKTSKVVYSAYYTTNNQYTFYLNPEIYLGQEDYFLTTTLQYSRIFDKFYGIGGQTPEIKNSLYKENFLLADLNFNFLFGKYILLGLRYKIESHYSIEPRDNPYLIEGGIIGIQGGISSGLGFKIIQDTRDNIFYPTKGFFNELRCTFNSKTIGSQYDFNEYEIDLRNYSALTKNQLLAFEIYFNSIRGYPPFYNLAKLGGEKRMRGYFQGRFRDQNYYVFQAELRTLLIWRFLGNIFFAVGDVSNKISNFKLTQAKYSYGFGLRFTIDPREKLNVRFDIGFGKNSTGFYFNLEEAF
jgi:outer membrane protein assembly factor BamA